MLKAKGGAGTVNPKTGLLEFSTTGKRQDHTSGVRKAIARYALLMPSAMGKHFHGTTRPKAATPAKPRIAGG